MAGTIPARIRADFPEPDGPTIARKWFCRVAPARVRRLRAGRRTERCVGFLEGPQSRVRIRLSTVSNTRLFAASPLSATTRESRASSVTPERISIRWKSANETGRSSGSAPGNKTATTRKSGFSLTGRVRGPVRLCCHSLNRAPMENHHRGARATQDSMKACLPGKAAAGMSQAQ